MGPGGPQHWWRPPQKDLDGPQQLQPRGGRGWLVPTPAPTSPVTKVGMGPDTEAEFLLGCTEFLLGLPIPNWDGQVLAGSPVPHCQDLQTEVFPPPR